ncbi:MAG: hypothetical protein H6996_02005 [Moraxellaceae bacterium]|nr:hypothetical protein [Pseudomonadales bacterium]MCP5173862.1 hypothetical protein [Moraxellaceae bacterium]MCP5176820.1 hypothetical protein [Moraxellaceae bacterium]
MSRCFITGYGTSGNPVISAIHLNKQKGKYVIHELATAFGRENFNNWISKRKEKVIYYNKNKSPANSTLPHLLGQSKTAHVGVVDSKASKQNILTPSDVVNKLETASVGWVEARNPSPRFCYT